MPAANLMLRSARSQKISCVVPSKDCLSNSAAAADTHAEQRFWFYRCNSERQRRKREVSSSYGTTTALFCERAVKGCKFAYCRSALRKCKNAVFAGVLSPISFAVERNGAAGGKKDKHIRRHGQKYLASGDAKYPRGRNRETSPNKIPVAFSPVL